MRTVVVVTTATRYPTKITPTTMSGPVTSTRILSGGSMVRATWLRTNLKSRHGLRRKPAARRPPPGGNRAGVGISFSTAAPRTVCRRATPWRCRSYFGVPHWASDLKRLRRRGRPPGPAPRTDGHTRVQPTLGFLQPLQQRHVRQVRQMRLSGANHRLPQRVSAAEMQQKGPQQVVDRLVFAQPLQRPGILASSRQSRGRKDNSTSQSSSTVPASVSCIRRSGYAGHAAKTS